jgi:hypothetical protein
MNVNFCLQVARLTSGLEIVYSAGEESEQVEPFNNIDSRRTKLLRTVQEEKKRMFDSSNKVNGIVLGSDRAHEKAAWHCH